MKKIIYITTLLIVVFGLQACSMNDLSDSALANMAPDGMVTVKYQPNKDVYFQWDDNTTLMPVNPKGLPLSGKETRAIVSFDEVEHEHTGYTKAVHVNWLDPVKTTALMPNTENNTAKYGSQTVEIFLDKMTGISDGYLTVGVVAFVGILDRHSFSLVRNVNPEDPYELQLFHNANDDSGTSKARFYLAFNLRDLPPTDGVVKKLTIKWRSIDGDQSMVFDYKTPKMTVQ